MSDHDLKTVLVNRADWTLPEGVAVPAGWVIANAPRPLIGQARWEGLFRHGIHYAASPEVPGGSFGWKADDGWLVTFITNDEIALLVQAKLEEHGYKTPEDVDSTVAELAIGTLQLPWHEEAGR
jgi:hypothetical protein